MILENILGGPKPNHSIKRLLHMFLAGFPEILLILKLKHPWSKKVQHFSEVRGLDIQVPLTKREFC